METYRMAGATVKVDAATYAKLKRTAAETGQSMVEVLAKAVETYRRQTFLAGLNADFAALHRDRRAWAAEKSERAAWDATLADDRQGD
jgi:hypothetical protein